MCNMNNELLYKYVDNTLEPLEKIFVEEHLKYCVECNEEMNRIKNTDKVIENFDFEEIDFPDRLFDLTELVIENCMREEGNENPDLYYQNYKEGLKMIKKSSVEMSSIRHNNPYNNAIKRNVNVAAGIVKNTVSKYCKKKFENSRIAKSRLYKILKAV